MNNFAEIERTKVALLREKDKRIAEHAAWLKQCDTQLAQLSQRTKLLTQGVDLSRLDRGRKILVIYGDATKVVLDRDGQYGDGVRQNAVAAARQWLTESPERLRERYIGVKNYSGFGDQREDHQYGSGPRHGTIMFSIGLTNEARKRDLAPDEIEDALYLLHILPAIAEAQKKAA